MRKIEFVNRGLQLRVYCYTAGTTAGVSAACVSSAGCVEARGWVGEAMLSLAAKDTLSKLGHLALVNVICDGWASANGSNGNVAFVAVTRVREAFLVNEN